MAVETPTEKEIPMTTTDTTWYRVVTTTPEGESFFTTFTTLAQAEAHAAKVNRGALDVATVEAY